MAGGGFSLLKDRLKGKIKVKISAQAPPYINHTSGTNQEAPVIHEPLPLAALLQNRRAGIERSRQSVYIINLWGCVEILPKIRNGYCN